MINSNDEHNTEDKGRKRQSENDERPYSYCRFMRNEKCSFSQLRRLRLLIVALRCVKEYGSSQRVGLE